MNITEAAKVNSLFRSRRKAFTLAAAIQRRLDYLTKIGEATPADAYAAARTIEELNQYIARLDSNELISHTSLTRRPVKEVLSEIFQGKGEPSKAVLPPQEKALVDLMNELGKQSRATYQTQLLKLEIAFHAKRNWYLVFNTLTVAPGEYMKVFAPDSLAFKNYIQRVSRSLGDNTRDRTERHRYFAVVEEGGKTGRLHIHVLHFMARLPFNARDPNTGLPVPYRRELTCLKSFWPHGNSSPIMVRYSLNDAYGKAGYRWPYDVKTKKGLQAKGSGAIAGYMTKYVTKSYNSEKRTKYQWRIRKTQNLGQQIPSLLASGLTTQTLKTIISTPTIRTRLNELRLSNLILRPALIRELQSRMSIKTLCDYAAAIQPRPSLLIASRDLTQTIDGSSLLNSTHLPIFGSKNEATYNAAQHQLDNVAQALADLYFQETTHAPASLATRPNN